MDTIDAKYIGRVIANAIQDGLSPLDPSPADATIRLRHQYMMALLPVMVTTKPDIINTHKGIDSALALVEAAIEAVDLSLIKANARNAMDAMSREDLKKVVNGIRDVMWPKGNPDKEWGADTHNEVMEVLATYGVAGPVEEE